MKLSILKKNPNPYIVQLDNLIAKLKEVRGAIGVAETWLMTRTTWHLDHTYGLIDQSEKELAVLKEHFKELYQRIKNES